MARKKTCMGVDVFAWLALVNMPQYNYELISHLSSIGYDKKNVLGIAHDYEFKPVVKDIIIQNGLTTQNKNPINHWINML